jgi:hypothetical protein
VIRDDDRHGGRGSIPLPLAPQLAICLCCHWLATGPDFRIRAIGHRNQTSHAVLAGIPPEAGPG